MFLRYTKLGTAMRAMANDRGNHRHPRGPSRVEAAAWLGCGVLAGIAGLLLAPIWSRWTPPRLTFLVISSLAAVLDAQAALDHDHLRGRDRGRPAA